MEKTLILGDAGVFRTIYEVNPDISPVINTLPIVLNGHWLPKKNGTAVSAPTMNEWEMILFTAFAGIASVHYLRKKERRRDSLLKELKERRMHAP